MTQPTTLSTAHAFIPEIHQIENLRFFGISRYQYKGRLDIQMTQLEIVMLRWLS